MAYKEIGNLYKYVDIFLFRECYAMEKIHGTSAHIKWKKGKLTTFGGSTKPDTFAALFDLAKLTKKFEELGIETVIIYGEAYGGKLMKMRDTYGPDLRFIVFEVQIDEHWLSVPQAEDFVLSNFELEFVHYVKIPTELEAIDAERDADSVQAIRNGMGEGKKREGVVLRTLIELTKNNGSRVIVKHKRFKETKTARVVSPEQLQILTDAKEIAEEWVTEMRLTHVLDKIENPSMRKMQEIIVAMFEDIKREGEGEIVWSREAQRTIGAKTAQMAKARFQQGI